MTIEHFQNLVIGSGRATASLLPVAADVTLWAKPISHGVSNKIPLSRRRWQRPYGLRMSKPRITTRSSIPAATARCGT
jgi:hypothetical protein